MSAACRRGARVSATAIRRAQSCWCVCGVWEGVPERPARKPLRAGPPTFRWLPRSQSRCVCVLPVRAPSLQAPMSSDRYTKRVETRSPGGHYAGTWIRAFDRSNAGKTPSGVAHPPRAAGWIGAVPRGALCAPAHGGAGEGSGAGPRGPHVPACACVHPLCLW